MILVSGRVQFRTPLGVIGVSYESSIRGNPWRNTGVLTAVRWHSGDRLDWLLALELRSRFLYWGPYSVKGSDTVEVCIPIESFNTGK